MADCVGVILAAGQSKRMGAVNKLLIPIDGVPMVRRSVLPYLEICKAPVHVVTGFERSKIEEALSGLDVKFIFNPEFSQGQKSSVACALKTLNGQEDILLGLGDQPFLTSSDIRWLLERHRVQHSPHITIPTRQGARGNPLAIAGALKSRLLADRKNPGCHKFTRENPSLAFHAEDAPAAFFHDIDTPKDIKALQPPKNVVLLWILQKLKGRLPNKKQAEILAKIKFPCC